MRDKEPRNPIFNQESDRRSRNGFTPKKGNLREVTEIDPRLYQTAEQTQTVRKKRKGQVIKVQVPTDKAKEAKKEIERLENQQNKAKRHNASFYEQAQQLEQHHTELVSNSLDPYLQGLDQLGQPNVAVRVVKFPLRILPSGDDEETGVTKIRKGIQKAIDRNKGRSPVAMVNRALSGKETTLNASVAAVDVGMIMAHQDLISQVKEIVGRTLSPPYGWQGLETPASQLLKSGKGLEPESESMIKQQSETVAPPTIRETRDQVRDSYGNRNPHSDGTDTEGLTELVHEILTTSKEYELAEQRDIAGRALATHSHRVQQVVNALKGKNATEKAEWLFDAASDPEHPSYEYASLVLASVQSTASEELAEAGGKYLTPFQILSESPAKNVVLKGKVFDRHGVEKHTDLRTASIFNPKTRAMLIGSHMSPGSTAEVAAGNNQTSASVATKNLPSAHNLPHTRVYLESPDSILAESVGMEYGPDSRDTGDTYPLSLFDGHVTATDDDTGLYDPGHLQIARQMTLSSDKNSQQVTRLLNPANGLAPNEQVIAVASIGTGVLQLRPNPYIRDGFTPAVCESAATHMAQNLAKSRGNTELDLSVAAFTEAVVANIAPKAPPQFITSMQEKMFSADQGIYRDHPERARSTSLAVQSVLRRAHSDPRTRQKYVEISPQIDTVYTAALDSLVEEAPTLTRAEEGLDISQREYTDMDRLIDALPDRGIPLGIVTSALNGSVDQFANPQFQVLLREESQEDPDLPVLTTTQVQQKIGHAVQNPHFVRAPYIQTGLTADKFLFTRVLPVVQKTAESYQKAVATYDEEFEKKNTFEQSLKRSSEGGHHSELVTGYQQADQMLDQAKSRKMRVLDAYHRVEKLLMDNLSNRGIQANVNPDESLIIQETHPKFTQGDTGEIVRSTVHIIESGDSDKISPVVMDTLWQRYSEAETNII